MSKIMMPVPLVELDGDEMTRIIWKMIKDYLIEPYVNLNSEYYDLGLLERDATNDSITHDAANAIKKYGVGVKCATITPNMQRVQEYGLKQMWKSPNGTIRAILDGTVFRKPILAKSISPSVSTWQKPITVARHAFGDIYSAQDIVIDGEATAELVITNKDGSETRRPIATYNERGGVVMGMYNTTESIENFAKCCFNYALDTHQDIWFATKDTISKHYHHRFKDIFQEVFERSYEKQFNKEGIVYFYTLIDDAVARVIRSKGGFIWACMNYDGDVMSDMVATAYGSLAMMTSVLVSPDGYYEFEAAHGTVTKHYYKHMEGKETSTNSMATIFAWTGALRKRGELDGNDELIRFADKLEKASLYTIEEEGVMTGDLYLLSNLENKRKVGTEEFIKAIKTNLDMFMGEK
jgi:isocitrate dehydrogenase